MPIDGLKGFPDAIKSVFPETNVQLCVVHQIRNSLKYVGSKNQKVFLTDLKRVYSAVSKEAAETQLDSLETKWGEQYPIVIKSSSITSKGWAKTLLWIFLPCFLYTVISIVYFVASYIAVP